MKYLLILASLLATGFCSGSEFILLNKEKVQYDDIVMAKESPTVFISAKYEKATTTYRFSQIELTSLPEKMQQDFAAYKSAQLEKRIILKDDKWISRDAMLLKADKKYGYAKPLAKVGDSILEFVNSTENTVTLGIRSGDKGYEMYIEAGKKKSYQVPNGIVHYIMAQESPDGKSLLIQSCKDQDMKHLKLTVTITPAGDVPPGDLGSIAIPSEYQVPVAPAK